MSKVGFCSKVLVIAACLSLTTAATGQDQPAPKEAKAAPTTADAKQFEELFAVRAELGKKLGKLQTEITAAAKAKDTKQQQTLIDQFNGMVTEFEAKTLPKLLALAGPLYIKDAQNADAE